MKAFFALVKLQFQSLITQTSQIGGGSKRKRKASGAGPLLFFAALFLYIGVVYAGMLFAVLGPIGAYDIPVSLMAFMAVLFCFLFTFFTGQGLLYGAKYNDLLLSLPVSAFSVMLSKTAALYGENLLLTAMLLGPAAVLYVIKGYGSLYFIIFIVLGILLLPLLPCALSVAGGYVSAKLTSKMKHKTLFSSVFSLSMFVVILIGSFKMNTLLNTLTMYPDSYRAWMAKYVWPLSLFLKGTAGGDPVSFLLFALLSLVPFLAIVALFSLSYKKLLSGLSATPTARDYKLGAQQGTSAFSALLRKEIGRYFGSNVYFINSAVGILMAWMGCVYLFISRASIGGFIDMLGDAPSSLFPAIGLAALAMFELMVPTAASSISMEGGRLWIIREAPVSTRQIFTVKVLWNFLLCLLIAIPCPPVFLVCGLITPLDTLLLIILGIIFALFTGLVGLCLNLWLPKMDAMSDIAVVKQSGAVMCATFGAMLLPIPFGVLYAKLFFHLPFVLFAGVIGLVFALACVALVFVLNGWGQKRFVQL